MAIQKLRLTFLILMLCSLTAGISFVIYFFSAKFDSSSSPSPPSPPSPPFSVKIPALSGVFMEKFDPDYTPNNTLLFTVSTYGNYWITENKVDTSSITNYKITLDIRYYQIPLYTLMDPECFEDDVPLKYPGACCESPIFPPTANVQIGSSVENTDSMQQVTTFYPQWDWAPSYKPLQAVIQVDPTETLSDQKLSVKDGDVDIDLLRYSLQNGVLTIEYNLNLHEMSAAGTDFPKFDVSMITKQSYTDDSGKYTSNKNMCTCSYKDLNYEIPGFVLITLSIGITFTGITVSGQPASPFDYVADYKVLICSAFLDDTLQSIPIHTFFNNETSQAITGPLYELAVYCITVSKNDATIVFGNKIITSTYDSSTCAVESGNNTITFANKFSTSASDLSFLKDDNNPACDLCNTDKTRT